MFDRRGELRQVVAGVARLGDQGVAPLRNLVGCGGRAFGFAAHELARPLHVADHSAEIGFQKIDRFADAADLDRADLDGTNLDRINMDRLIRRRLNVGWFDLNARRSLVAFCGLSE